MWREEMVHSRPMEEPVLRKHTSLHVPAHSSLQVTPVHRLLGASPIHVKMMELALKDPWNLTSLKVPIAQENQGSTSLKHPTALNYTQLSLAHVHQTI